MITVADKDTDPEQHVEIQINSKDIKLELQVHRSRTS